MKGAILYSYSLLLFTFGLFVFPSSVHAVLINADGLLGQTSYTASTTAVTAEGFSGLLGYNALDTKNHRLFVVDDGNARVLVFQLSSDNEIVSTTASYVLGQADFTSSTIAVTQSGLRTARGIAYDSTEERLFLGDGANHRVLVYNVDPGTISNGMNASYVLGQADFTSSTAATSQNGFDTPRGVMYDPEFERVFVMDALNNRTMIFDVDPDTITSGENALNVLGQADFTSSTNATTQSSMSGVRGSSYDHDHNRLFISDVGNSRVLSVSMVRITTASLPNGQDGLPYSQNINVTASHDTLSYSVVDGSLPAGLSLNTSSGVISGVPTTIATNTFTIQVNDTSATGSFIDRRTLSIGIDVVASGPPVGPGFVFYIQGKPYSTNENSGSSAPNTNISNNPSPDTISPQTGVVMESKLSQLVGPFSLGITSSQVTLLQEILAQDKDIYPEGLITGYYGPLTRKAVERFQTKYNIVASGAPNPIGFGLAGPKTRGKIKEVFATQTGSAEATVESLGAQIKDIQVMLESLQRQLNSRP